jgi:putative ABC transport system permease protein
MMLGCVLGVAALNLVVGVGSSVEKRLVGSVQRYFSASSILVTSGGNPFGGGPRGDAARLTLDDLEAVASGVPSIEIWDPMQVLDPVTIQALGRATTGRVMGSSENAERVWQRGATSGEYFDRNDVTRSSRVALIGVTLARKLFGGDDPVGSEVTISGAPFRVVGVLEPMGTDIHGIDRDNEVVVPISTLMRRIMNVDSIRGAKLLVRDPAQVQSVAREIKALLKERHGLAAEQTDDFTVVTPVEVMKMVALTKRILFVFMPLVAMLALLVGGVVAASLMILSVTQRTNEIGIRRAIGARARDIARQFLLEATATTLVGGILGTAIGAAGSVFVARHLSLPSSLSWGAIVGGVALSLVTGLLAGVAPARRAALLPPVDALR